MIQLFTPTSRNAQAIVVLGNNPPPGIYQWCKLPCFPLFDPAYRIHNAACCYRQSGLPILLSGGVTSRRTESEAQSMQRELKDQYGISTDWLEEESHTTLDNAIYTAALLQQKQVNHILVATHPWHFPRAAQAFRQLGLKADLCFPGNLDKIFPEKGLNLFLPRMCFAYLAHLSLREWLARLVYRWMM